MKDKNTRQIIITIGIIAAAAILLYFSVASYAPGIWESLREGNEEALEAYLKSRGRVGGLLALFFLQLFQVITIILPAAPIRVAGGMVYGTPVASAICYGAYLLANAIVFLAARQFASMSESMASLLPRKGKNSRELLQWLQTGDPLFLTALACMLPIVPNGIIPYAAAKRDVSFLQFLFSVAIGSVAPVLLMCGIGRRILSGDYVIAVLLMIVYILLVVLTYRNRDVLHRLYHRIRRRYHAFYVSHKRRHF